MDWWRTGNVPLHGWGYVTLEAATGPTASVAATIRRLHATPHIDASSIKATRVASFAGQTFDATIVGTDRPPVCRTIRCAEGVSIAGKGQLFHIIVVDVRGKTVVIYLESGFADQPRFPPAKTFPTFLPYAQQMLATLRFPVK